uniref:MICOS complex subunit MIC10 n=1 Tax=Parastrongyloides trichosuri TaxID=131310 RepID=A0A0N4ZLA6_PARTI
MGYRSEDLYAEKWDRCFADTGLKVAAGVATGILASFLIFQRRTFPVWLGAGWGLGSGFTNCNHEINSPYLLHGKKVKDGSGKEIIQVDGEPKLQN